MKSTVAYSYVRFSTPKQQHGDSLRRQVTRTEALCKKHGWALDTTLTLQDLGVSAFHGDNAATGALSAFLDAIKDKRVARGSVLVIESLDRLSRGQVRQAFRLWDSILSAGINIATIEPERIFTNENSNDLIGLVEPLLVFARANEESATKSYRGRQFWHAKRQRAGQVKMTAKAPAWLRLKPDRTAFEPIPAAVKAVRRIFKMAKEGHSLLSIARVLNEKHPPIKGTTGWSNAYVNKILKNRAVLGEYQPHVGRSGNRTPVGDPIPDYFPVIIDPETFDAAQRGLKSRVLMRGRQGEGVSNLFQGLLYDGRDRSRLRVYVTSGKRNYLSGAAVDGRPVPARVCIRRELVEAGFVAIVQSLNELREADDPTDTIRALEAERDATAKRIADIQERLAGDEPLDSLLPVLGKLEARHKEILSRLQELSLAAGERRKDDLVVCQQLIKEMWRDGITPAELTDVRTRLKAKIRQIVTEMWLVAWGPRTKREAELQVHFRDGKSGGVIISAHREYFQPYFMEGADLLWDLRKYDGWFDDPELRSEILSLRGFE